jgi:hypothetical protein
VTTNVTSGLQTGPQGRSIVVPTFVNTFVSPIASVSSLGAISAVASLAGSPALAACSTANISALPALGQPFIVGPGFSPIPAKLVTRITSGKFIEMADLLAANLQQIDLEPQVLFDGRLVLTTGPKRQNKQLEDIAAWVEAFSIYTLVLARAFPHRWRDLTQYKLLILRTSRQFGGNVWLTYDRAFREHAAAANVTDWSTMNVEIFNFHSAGVSKRTISSSTKSVEQPTEPTGSDHSTEICRSWNRGRCSSPFTTCRYLHKCVNCRGSHRTTECLDKPYQSSSQVFSQWGQAKRKRP